MPPISAADLTTLRSQSPYQAVVKWYLAIAPYGDPIWTAQVDDAGGTIDDPNMVIPFDGASSALSNVSPGMTLWIGSTSEGRDEGILRVRGLVIEFSSGSTEFTIGETLTGATSGDTAVVVSYAVWSGTWAGGDAAGDVVVMSASGAFQAENLNGSSGGANMATADGAITHLSVAENYDIEWADDLYLTLPGEDGFREIWGKYQRLDEDGYYWKDYDIAYEAAGETGAPGENIKPKANAGPPCVAWLNDSGYVDVDFVADESDIFGSGETITGYTWDFGDGAVQSWGDADHMGTEGSPNVVRFSSTGFRYVKLTVTCSSGETGVTYIPVWTFDEGTVDPVTSVDVLDQTGSVNNGWTATIRVRDTDNDTIYDIPDGALVVLFTKTEIDGSEVSIGGYHDRNNIRMVGWVDEETFVFDHETGYVEFQILGHGGKMRRCYGMGFSLETSADPTAEDYDAWYYATDLNVDRAIQWFLEWHTTVNQVAHVNKRGEGANKSFTRWICGETNLYEQVQSELVADATYHFLADRQGIFHVTTNPQFLPVASRDTSICTLQQGDWRNDIDARRQPKRIGWVKIGGFNDDTPLLSWAPGDAPGYAAGEIDREGFIVESQTQLNLWSGFMLANENNPYPEVTVELDGYWPVFDHAFQEWLSLSADDPLDRNDWSLERFLIRGVSYRDLSEDGTTVTELTLEKSTTGPAGITKEVPDLPTIEWPTPPPPTPPPAPPPDIEPYPEEPMMAMAWTEHQVAWCEDILAAGGPTWVDVGTVSAGDFNQDIYDLKLVQTDDTNIAAWVITDNGVYYTDSVMAASTINSAGWSGKLDIATAQGMMDQGADGIFTCCAVYAADPDYLIVGIRHTTAYRYNTYPAYKGGFVYTTDRGVNWSISQMPNDNDGLLSGGYTNRIPDGDGISIDQTTGDIRAFRWGGLYSKAHCVVESTDGGANFAFKSIKTYFNTGLGDRYGNACAAVVSPDTIYFFVNKSDSNHPFYRKSTDGGDSWSNIMPAGYEMIGEFAAGGEVLLFDGNILYAWMRLTATSVDYVMKSTDGGSSWSQAGSESDVGFDGGKLTMWPGSEDMVFAVDQTYHGSSATVMAYTDDGGSTWHDLTGNWFTEFGTWAGTQSDAHSPGIALLPRVGENAIDE